MLCKWIYPTFRCVKIELPKFQSRVESKETCWIVSVPHVPPSFLKVAIQKIITKNLWRISCHFNPFWRIYAYKSNWIISQRVGVENYIETSTTETADCFPSPTQTTNPNGAGEPKCSCSRVFEASTFLFFFSAAAKPKMWKESFHQPTLDVNL